MSEIKVNSVVNSTGDNDSGLDLSTNDQVIIKTANTTALTIDSSQNVTNAGNLTVSGNLTVTGTATGTSVAGSNAFAARHSASDWATILADNYIPFNDDSSGDCFDTDGVYNTSTYKFTAPATGVYTFWFGIYTANADNANAFGFFKNNTRLNMSSAGGKHFTFRHTDTADHIQNAQVILPLTSGDTMGVCATTGSDYYQGEIKFGGCRLA